MRITAVNSWIQAVPLSRPYTIASMTIEAVDLGFVQIETEPGVVGVGSASPAEDVTGESAQACREALSADRLGWLIGRDARHLGALCRQLEHQLAATPAARAAVDMALYDLFARSLGVPVVDFLGRCHHALPTTVTIGISSVEQTLAEAEDLLGQGFRCLKIKIGRSLEHDVERLNRLREQVGSEIPLLVDANQGYSVEQTCQLQATVDMLDLKLVEQPLAAVAVAEMRSLPASLRRTIAADESLHSAQDALALSRQPAACGVFNIKLMKCGGITPALAIAGIAQATDIALMWGCNDESRISITAALHAAYACPSTRYLDLDGSFDLARDPAEGGFEVKDGCLMIRDQPGLGVHLADPA